MATITSSPITFLDLTDQQQLSAYLTSNLSTVQFRGNDDTTYSPSWEDSPLIITLHAFLNQSEIDYVSGDYIFKWYVRDGLKEEFIQEGTSKTLVVDSNKLGTSESGMLTYMCEISCDSAETITTEITYTLISEGKSVVFSVYSHDGTVFKNQSGEIKLETIKYYGVNEITNDVSFQWYKLTSNGEVAIDGATEDIYTVYGQDVTNIASYKCKMTYNGVVYSDVITLQDISDNYASDILTIGGTVFKNGIGGSAAYIVVRANGQEEDALAGVISVSEPSTPEEGEYWYCVDNENDKVIKKQYISGAWVETDIQQSLTYTWSLMDKDGNITPFGSGKVVYLSCDNITDTTTLCCEITTSEGKLLSVSQETFIDLYDSYNVVITPEVATVPCNNSGNIIYSTDSEGNAVPINYEFNYIVDIQNSVIDASCVTETVEGLIIDTSTPGVIKISMDTSFNFGDTNDFSLKISITTNDKQEFTFERYITFIKIKEGEGAVSFNVYAPEGDVFKEGVEQIVLNTVAYCGSATIIDAAYAWYYFENNEWHQIYEEYESANQEEILVIEDNTDVFEEDIEDGLHPVTTPSIIILKNAEYAFSTLKCVIEYPVDSGIYYEDYILLKDYYNPYTATIKFLNDSNVIGVEDLFVVAYAELYKNNNEVDSLLTKTYYYSSTNSVGTDGVIATDYKAVFYVDESIDDTTTGIYYTRSGEDPDYTYTEVALPDSYSVDTTYYSVVSNYFVYKVDESYSIVLGEYNVSQNKWIVVESSQEYAYSNSLYTENTSKIIVIPKEDIVNSKELNFSVYNILLDSEGNQIYDDDLLLDKSDTIIINLNDKLGDIPGVAKDVREYMTFDSEDGLTISQKDSTTGEAPFYVNITSTRMGFHEVSENSDGEKEDKEVVYIGNNAATITNMTVQQSADFECSIDMLNMDEDSKATYPGISFIIEDDGSFSLIKMEVK